MKKSILIAIIGTMLLTSCNSMSRVTDSEISAIRDQTEVLKKQNELIAEQNKILSDIATKLK